MARPLLLEKECTPKCQSNKHVDTITSLITKVSLLEFQAHSSLCYNWSQLSDLSGRTALHLAASCGRVDILEWILEEKKVDLSAKDLESGYTALHRAVFYGQLAAAKILTQYDSDFKVADNEGLTPLDLSVYDRPAYITYSINEPNEVSTWGENINSMLGHPSTHKRTNPDVISEFKKLGLSIKQMVLCKYHSVFLTQNGLVFTCGHGQGGRLGHGEQHTVLVPKLLHSVKHQTCVEIAAGTDHTLMRMEGGAVFSCGLNTCRQLGQGPDVESSLWPKQVKCKGLKKKVVIGVGAGRFHTVIWTSDEMYSAGLNAGQLGHPKGDKYVDQLLLVPSLRTSTVELVAVTCSDAATACLTAKGDVYVLHEYQCKRIAVRLSAIEQIVMTGGTLDHHTGVDMLMEKGGHELILVLRSKWGQLYVWRDSNRMVKRCRWKMKHQLTVSDVAVSETNLVVTTDRGQAYMGKLSNKKSQKSDTVKEQSFKDSGDVAKQPRLLDRLVKEEVEEVVATRISGVHRALVVASDKKGRNFAVVQALPNGCLSTFPSVSTSMMHENIGRLLVEADINDIVHDAVIQVGDRSWPVHRYIIGMRSHHFHQVCHSAKTKLDAASVFRVEGVNPDLMDQIVQFMYTDTCDFLTPGYKVKIKTKPLKADGKSSNTSKCEPEEDEFDDLGLSGKQITAFEVNQRRKKNEKNKESVKKNSKGDDQSGNLPVKMLQEAAQKLGIKNLSKRLDQVKCNRGVISAQRVFDKIKFHFDRMKFPELYDVTIVTEDGNEIPCHKCVLVARLEYFYSMFATGWIESMNSTRLTLPAPGDALEILIDYLYTDDAPQLTDCYNEKLLCEVLVVSDQLLVGRLKELCEVALANIISFRNVGELLEFSSVYNADQLKESCQQFVSLNLSAVLEARILEMLTDETLQDLTSYYRSTIPNVGYRLFTPPSEGVEQTYLDQLVAEYESLSPEFIDGKPEVYDSTRKAKQAKKRGKQRVKSVSEDDNKQNVPVPNPPDSERLTRHVSVGSDVSGKLDEDIMSIVEETNKRIEEEEKKTALQASKKEKISKPDGPKVASSVPSHPQDIPTWTSKLKSLSWASTNTNHNNSFTYDERSPNNTIHPTIEGPASPSSPVSPPPSPSLLATSPTSLREIMKQEFQTSASSRPERKASFPSHFSRKGGKKHHKIEEVEESSPQAVSKSTACPWSSVSGVVSSFRDLMLQDKVKTPPDGASVSTKVPVMSSPPSGSSSSRSGRHRKSTPITIPFKSPSNESVSPRAENPWQRRAESAAAATAVTTAASYVMASSTSPSSALNFSDILEDEREKEEILIKIKQKPLALIQLEEKAMQELLHYYHAADRVDDYVTVERVSKNVAAAPIWHRERLSSGTY